MNRLWRPVLAPLRSTVPDALSEDLYWGTVLAVLLLAVAIGLQATAIAMIVLGPLAPPIPPETLTQMGRANMRPEWDLPAFYAGCFLTVGLCFATVRLWSARLARAAGPRAALAGAALHVLLAAGSLAAFVALVDAERPGLTERPRVPPAAAARLSAPALAALVVLAGYHARARRPPAARAPDAEPRS